MVEKKTKRKLSHVVLVIFAFILLMTIVASCRHRQRGTEWMKTASESEILKELVNDCGCIDILSVMLRAPQSSLERIIAGESLPTESFSMQIRQLAGAYYSDGMTWKKLCKQYLPSSRFSRWYPAVCSSHFWLYFVIGSIAFIIILVFLCIDLIWLGILDIILNLVFAVGASLNVSKLVENCNYQTEDAIEISISSSPSLSDKNSNLTYVIIKK